jgi:hypothetical protein
MFDAKRAGAPDEPVHRRTVEGAGPSLTVRTRQTGQQLQVHFLREAAESAVADVGRLVKHARLEMLRDEADDLPPHVEAVDGVDVQPSGRRSHTGHSVDRETARRNRPDISYRHAGQTELVITGGGAVTGHDPWTGKELWRADVLYPTNNGAYRIVASTTIVGGLSVAPSRNNPMVAIRPGGTGDVAATHIAWTFERGPDVPTPVSDGAYIYVVNDNGVVYCLDVKTCAVVDGPVCLPPGTYSSSPVLADGKMYVTMENDDRTSVFKAGPAFEPLATNPFGEGCSPYCLSSMAVSEGQLFLRSTRHLWVIGERRGPR